MSDLSGKVAALLLLASAAFNIYIGANVPIMESVMKTFGVGSGQSVASTLPLIIIFVAAGLYGLVAILLLSVKSIKALNVVMAIACLAMAGGLSYSAVATYQNASTVGKIVNTASTVIGGVYGEETGDKYKQSMTAIGVYPAYASIAGAVAGGLSAFLIFNRST
jgi:hypothetical protein